MTEVEIKEFRDKFKRIVYLKSEITTINTRIAAYTQKDRDGNYQQAILRAIEKKQEKKTEFDGLSVEDFILWFYNKKEEVFEGQIICWNDDIDYG